MQYVGTKRSPAPLMKDCEITNEIVKQSLHSIRTLYTKAEIVHGDLSEYNFLIHRKKPYVIDIAQALDTNDIMSKVLLKRDVGIMTRFLINLGISLTKQKY